MATHGTVTKRASQRSAQCHHGKKRRRLPETPRVDRGFIIVDAPSVAAADRRDDARHRMVVVTTTASRRHAMRGTGHRLRSRRIGRLSADSASRSSPLGGRRYTDYRTLSSIVREAAMYMLHHHQNYDRLRDVDFEKERDLDAA